MNVIRPEVIRATPSLPSEYGMSPAVSGARQKALHGRRSATAPRLYRQAVLKGKAFEVGHDASPLRRWNILIEKVLQRPASTDLLYLSAGYHWLDESRFAHDKSTLQPLSSDRRHDSGCGP